MVVGAEAVIFECGVFNDEGAHRVGEVGTSVLVIRFADVGRATILEGLGLFPVN